MVDSEGDTKREFAFSTIENIGYAVVMMACGALMQPEIGISQNVLIVIAVVALLIRIVADYERRMIHNAR